MSSCRPLRVAVMGCGFWAKFQVAAWKEVPGVEVVALYNRTRSKAQALAGTLGIGEVHDDAEVMLQRVKPDAVDIITDVDTHSRFVAMAAAHRIPVICQKPMAPSLNVAEEMVATCRKAKVPFFVHENWRWQTPIRHFKSLLAEGCIGTPFRSRIDFITGFPVFSNQPFLRELDQFILTDIGSHILDVARFLFGEAETLYCQTARIHQDIKGEDVASVMMKMGGRTTVVCQMAYAENHLEHDRFPETRIFVEGDKGSLELGPDYWIRLTDASGTHARRCPPPRYSWADPAYDLVQASIVPCNANLLQGLRGGAAETTGEDNLKTVRLVFASYESARSQQVIHL